MTEPKGLPVNAESPAPPSPSQSDSPPATTSGQQPRRKVRANLVEATPGAAGQWILASPYLVYVGWLWIDLFAPALPMPWHWLNVVLAVLLYIALFVLPSGLLAHWIVTALPGLFQNAGWDVQPLEPVRESEQYTVQYMPEKRIRAERSQARIWLRAAQGSVYLEIAVLLIAAVLLIPIFLSATDFGFGR